MTDGNLVLAFDTATETVAVAVGALQGSSLTLLGSHDFEAPRAAMSGLLPAVRTLLDDLGLTARDISSVVVGRGPGSFTGVRIGVATAKGIAHGLGVPLFGVGTLDAIVFGLPEDFTGVAGVLGDAMRGEVYPALFDISHTADGRRIRRRGPDSVSQPQDAARMWAALGEPLLLAGNGLAKYAEVFSGSIGSTATIAPQTSWAPTGAGLLRAFAASIEEGDAVRGEPGAVLPIYTRLSDAEEAERARCGLTPEPPPPNGVGAATPPGDPPTAPDTGASGDATAGKAPS